MEVTKRSMITGKVNTIFIEGLTQDMISAWENGALAQDAFVGISPALREFIMTGITPDEWDAVMPDEEEDDDTEWYV